MKTYRIALTLPPHLIPSPLMNDIHTAIRVLNEAFKADPVAISNMMGTRFSCSDTLADHPTIQVAAGDNAPHVGPLGIINGVLEAMTGQRVAAVYDEKGLAGFTLYQVPNSVSLVR
jgi:hypothetical protein